MGTETRRGRCERVSAEHDRVGNEFLFGVEHGLEFHVRNHVRVMARVSGN